MIELWVASCTGDAGPPIFGLAIMIAVVLAVLFVLGEIRMRQAVARRHRHDHSMVDPE